MKVDISLGNWVSQQGGARAVRDEVFVVEQAIPVELEWDEMDDHCVHAVALDDANRPVGTGRLLPDGHIGRMAVARVARGAGVGGKILQALMRAARERGDACVLLSAQLHAEAFYRRHGFVREGEQFMEAGIAHVAMRHRFAA